jgi:uncharacterized protein YneF (UPF0154 family)
MLHHANLLFLLGVCIMGFWVARRKAFWGMHRKIETSSSPLSKAVGELVGIAGGIYLALELLTSFLSVDLPEKITPYGLSLDPLAVVSIALALAQPYAVRIQNFFRKWL